MGLSRCHYQYISIYVTFLFVVATIFKFAYQLEGSHFNAELLLLVCYIGFAIFVILYFPYEAAIHNIGLVVNLLVVIYFLIWSTLKRFQVID